MPPAQTAIAWVLGNPGVAAASPAPPTRGTSGNCAALDIELDFRLQKEIDEFIRREGQLLHASIAQEMEAILSNPAPDSNRLKKTWSTSLSIPERTLSYQAGVDLFRQLLQLDPASASQGRLLEIVDEIREKFSTNKLQN